MYRIIDEINENTFIAIKFNRLYLLKKIHADDIEVYKKLMEIDCRYVAKVIEFTNIGDYLYVVLNYIQGDTLADYIVANGTLSDDEAKRLTVQICLGLKEIHNLGIVHRDINPKNIIIDDYSNAVIIDFGISRIHKSFQTADTQILGTKGYAAPEQFGFSQTGVRSDIYSLGVLMNYMKTGFLPSEKFAEGTFAEIIEKCTQIDEYNRYEDIDSLLNSLDSKNFKKKLSLRRWIPGFGSGVLWHEVVAVLYYLTLIIGIASVVRDDLKTSAVTAFFDAAAIAVMMLGIPAVIFDSGEWSKKFSFSKNKKRSEINLLKVLFSVVCVFISMVLVIIEQSIVG